MKSNKKRKILAIALVFALTAIIAAGSLAYFQAVDDATNIFNFGSGNSDKDAIDVDLWENAVNQVVDPVTGFITWAATEDKTAGNTYENVYPNANLPKNPTVTNIGTNSQYVRLVVTVSDELAAVCAAHGITDLDAIFVGNNPDDWARTNIIRADGKLSYVYTYQHILLPDADSTALFTSVIVPSVFTQADLTGLGNTFDIAIKAESIQADGFADMAAAWAAWDPAQP